MGSVSWGQATLPFTYDLGKPSSVTGLSWDLNYSNHLVKLTHLVIF